jgi:small multidrug resistance pump
MLIAIVLEVSGTTMMKLSQGFRRPLPTVLMFLFYGSGFVPLNLALRRLDVSLAYAVWSGLGTMLVTLIGIYYFREPATPLKLVSIALIVIGVLGLNLAGKLPGP